MKTGHEETQSMEEMITEMTEAKERGLTVPRGKSIYKMQSGEYQDDKLRELISLNLNALAEVVTKERISLEDLDEVKRRTVYYLRACEESSTFPSSLGLARSLGYSDRALRYWRSKHPESPTAQWLEIVNDVCSDILSQSALKNNANSILAIFLNKALYDLRETSEIVLTPNNIATGETEYSPEDIKRRYLPEAGKEG
jgi:hypothetical protein